MKLNANAFALIAGLFVILSPGLILTLPPLSKDQINTIGVSHGAAGAAVTCSATLTYTDDSCKKAERFFVSGYTSLLAIVVHALVYALLLNFVPEMVGLKAFGFNAIAVLSVLFLLLSPGLILTLPALTKIDCGINQKNIADAGDYCDAVTVSTSTPNCEKCTRVWNSGFTSLPAVLVHTLVFGGVAWFTLAYVK